MPSDKKASIAFWYSSSADRSCEEGLNRDFKKENII
jgi:hypothetical protein